MVVSPLFLPPRRHPATGVRAAWLLQAWPVVATGRGLATTRGKAGLCRRTVATDVEGPAASWVTADTRGGDSVLTLAFWPAPRRVATRQQRSLAHPFSVTPGVGWSWSRGVGLERAEPGRPRAQSKWIARSARRGCIRSVKWLAEDRRQYRSGKGRAQVKPARQRGRSRRS